MERNRTSGLAENADLNATSKGCEFVERHGAAARAGDGALSDTGNPTPVSDIAFTPSVKALQERLGSRKGYARMEERGGWENRITPELADFVAERDSIYLGTASADGRPYIQHRGGPPGFLKVLDDRTLAFADFGGNRQYISMGNLAENDKAFLFLMDYPNRRRIKIWGRAEVVEDDAELLVRLAVADYEGEPQRVFRFHVQAWDSNCPQHITPRFTAAEIARSNQELLDRIAALEREVVTLRRGLDRKG